MKRLVQLFVVALVLAPSCADPERMQYENRKHRKIETFEFERPIEQVWPTLVEVLAEDGFVLEQTSPVEDRTVQTDLRKEGGLGGYRVLIRVIRRDETKYKIKIARQYETREGKKSIESWNVVGRPTDRVTWALIERAEPARAAEISDDLAGEPSALGCS